MQDSGSKPSSQPSVITTPISKLQKSTSPPNLGKSGPKVEIFGLEFPEAETVEEYIATRKEPYTFHYFQMPDELRGIESYKEWGEFIDSFVLSEIDFLQLEDSVRSYENILDEVVYSLGIREDTVSKVKVEKLYKWIKNVLIPQRKIERRKKEILGG